MHVTTRLHNKTLQNFYTNNYEFEGWLRNTAFGYWDYSEFMEGMAVLLEDGFFAGCHTGISDIVMFSAQIPKEPI